VATKPAIATNATDLLNFFMASSFLDCVRRRDLTAPT
jgi:hypothetical protein